MNKFDKKNTFYKIDNYFMPTVHEILSNKDANAFERAKKECILNLQRDIKNVERFTYKDFEKLSKEIKGF